MIIVGVYGIRPLIYRVELNPRRTAVRPYQHAPLIENGNQGDRSHFSLAIAIAIQTHSDRNFTILACVFITCQQSRQC
jgi:hypothetical protein